MELHGNRLARYRDILGRLHDLIESYGAEVDPLRDDLTELETRIGNLIAARQMELMQDSLERLRTRKPRRRAA